MRERRNGLAFIVGDVRLVQHSVHGTLCFQDLHDLECCLCGNQPSVHVLLRLLLQGRRWEPLAVQIEHRTFYVQHTRKQSALPPEVPIVGSRRILAVVEAQSVLTRLANRSHFGGATRAHQRVARFADLFFKVRAYLLETIGQPRGNPQLCVLVREGGNAIGRVPSEEPVVLRDLLNAVPRQAQQQAALVGILALVP